MKIPIGYMVMRKSELCVAEYDFDYKWVQVSATRDRACDMGSDVDANEALEGLRADLALITDREFHVVERDGSWVIVSVPQARDEDGHWNDVRQSCILCQKEDADKWAAKFLDAHVVAVYAEEEVDGG